MRGPTFPAKKIKSIPWSLINSVAKSIVTKNRTERPIKAGTSASKSGHKNTETFYHNGTFLIQNHVLKV